MIYLVIIIISLCSYTFCNEDNIRKFKIIKVQNILTGINSVNTNVKYSSIETDDYFTKQKITLCGFLSIF
jgi:hypothetical protein